MAGAAATLQCIGQWAVEPDVGVGEGGADAIRCVGRGAVGGSWLRKPWLGWECVQFQELAWGQV